MLGCAASPPTIETNPLERPGVPQAVAVVAAHYPPESKFATFARGYPEGAAKGAALGTLGGTAIGLQLAPLAILAGPLGIAAALTGILVGGAVAGLAIGATAGAIAVVPEEHAAAIERLASTIVAELRLSERTADAVAADVRKFTAYRVETIAGEAPASKDDIPDFRSLHERGIGAVIDVRITKVGFAGTGGEDPPLSLFMAAQARLVDTATGSPTALRGLVHMSPQHNLSVWARDGAQRSRSEIERAYRALAERIVDDLVLQADAWLGADAPPPPSTCGMVPLQPALDWDNKFNVFTPTRPAMASVQSLTPTLAWDGTPTRIADRSPPWAQAKSESIQYDLRIWNAFEDAPDAIVYERFGLERPEHQVESALDPNSTYFWSVRLRYEIDHHPRATRWSATNVPAFATGMALNDELYRSRREEGAVKPVNCTYRDLTPCGCLDFIPAPNYYRFRTP
ncbi:MAG TPA: hypothetical protein PLW68_05195 [Casimicrobiaceae bacterium]|nr:hypothetical protein [Casimicrobiaceae bacterium]